MAASSPHVYLHSPLARLMYHKIMEDRCEQDHSEWYAFNTQLVPTYLATKFVQLSKDEETTAFLTASHEKSDWIFMQMFHSFVKFVLSWVMTKTSVNGLLQRGSMFVFSESHLEQLLSIDSMWKADWLLDLGAGDGAVTQRLARYFNQVFVTEMSSTMIWRLKQRNYTVLDVTEWDVNRQYDVISCLNLLDRCDEPLTLLQQIRSALKSNTGRLLLALVLPFSPYVEFGDSNHQPKQRLRILGERFEDQVASLVRNVLEPAGFELEKFSRLPYLCEGDMYHSYYVLHDVVLVLKPVALN